ncbi:MAG: hypothetical protein GY842_06430, partial [bacterium]|nr:hypothetical protein [bacterium]
EFDAGFQPDHLVFTNAWSGTIYVDQFTLPSAGATTKTYRGNGTVNDGDGFLSGGTNPNGMQIALNNTNNLGVTATDASGAATALHGFDMFVPYAYIGVTGGPNGDLGMAAYLVRSSGSVGNQWLPGLGGGYGNLGLSPDLTLVPGDQHVIVSLDIPGDWDGNGDVDLADYAEFPPCVTGPGGGPPAGGCTPFDFDGDGDIDLADVGSFQAKLGG